MSIQIPLSYETWYICMNVGIYGLDCYDILYIIMGITLILTLILGWVLYKIIVKRFKKTTQEDVEKQASEPEEDASKQTISSVKITKDEVLELDGHTYYVTDVPGVLARKRTEEEMTKRQHEDDFWHFVAAAAIVIWLTDSNYADDSEEMLAIKAFEAGSLAASGLEEFPHYTSEDFAGVEVDASEVAALGVAAESDEVADFSDTEETLDFEPTEQHTDEEGDPLEDNKGGDASQDGVDLF